MGQLAIALDRLAAVAVEGVTSYALDATPEALGRAQLPALVILPELAGDWPGLEPSPFAAAQGTFVARMAHLLLLAPVPGGSGMRGALPALAAAIDAYVAALAADPDLGGALSQPLCVGVAAGVVHYGGIDYHGATFHHVWTLRLGSGS